MDEEHDFSNSLKELSTALALCNEPELIEQFLISLLTESECKEVASRWALVQLIDKGVSQRKIAHNLGLSLCKITRGSRVLKEKESPFKSILTLYKDYIRAEDS